MTRFNHRETHEPVAFHNQQKNRRAERLREGIKHLRDAAEDRYWAKDVERQIGAEQEADFWSTYMMGKD